MTLLLTLYHHGNYKEVIIVKLISLKNSSWCHLTFPISRTGVDIEACMPSK